MSQEGDSLGTDLTVTALLQAILVQLKLQTEILKEVSGLNIKKGDLDG